MAYLVYRLVRGLMPRNLGSIPGMGKILFSSNHAYRFWGTVHWVKWPEFEADHSPLSSAQVNSY